jgi:tRNA-Thr(GGU) m(6)t(6)A37 methyltransferase TsaA
VTDPKELNYTSIGTYQGKAVKRYDVPRQSSLQEHQGIIRLHDGFNFQQAIEDLKGMERIWVIYHFHLNESHWKAKVNTPRTLDGKKKSVLATRAPYRPNPIGMSCVKLDEIKGLKLMVSESDLLDGSPILDIKPYIPYADSFAPSKMGWLDNIESAAYTLHYDEFALTQINWLEQKTGLDCKSYLERNLEYQPTNTRHKRVRKEKPADTYHLGLKTWRLHFRLDSEAKTIQVLKVFSGYSKEELDVQDDPHSDKETHKMFISEFLKFDSELENLIG